MPRAYKRKTNVAAYTTDMINSARHEVNVKKRSVREVSKSLGLSRTTLMRYLADGSDVKSLGRKGIFSAKEEELLCDYIKDCSKMFHGLNVNKTRELAYSYAINLQKTVPSSWVAGKMAGKDWLDGFRKRNATLSLRSPEATSLSRATAFNKTTVAEFFGNLEMVMRHGNYSPSQIFNLDETGISTVQKPQRVLAEKGIKQLGQVVSGERGTTVTMICCVNAAGQSLPPAYIFPRVHYKDHMLHGGPPGSKGFATASGWMTNDLFPQVLQHFISHMNASDGRKTLLLLDNHASHISVETVDLAKTNNLMLLTFPPHCSHRLQPLDVSVYGPFKTYLNSASDGWMLNNPGKTITIYNMAELSGQAYLRALTPSNICKGFSKSGISPLNKDIFDDHDFLSSYVTDRPHQETDTDPNSTSPLPPLPKAPPRKQTQNRKRTKSSILTMSPLKVIAETAPADICTTDGPSTSGLVVSRHSKYPREEESDEEDDQATPVSTDSEDPVSEPEEESLEVGKYAIVKFVVGKKSVVHYIGEIKDTTETDLKVDFYRKKGNRYFKPDQPDCQFVGKDQIAMVLPPPMSTGKTERSLGGIGFHINLDSYMMR